MTESEAIDRAVEETRRPGITLNKWGDYMTKDEAVNKAVSTFAAEIGYHEKAANSQ